MEELGSEGGEKLKAWVESGAAVIAIGDAATPLAEGTQADRTSHRGRGGFDRQGREGHDREGHTGKRAGQAGAASGLSQRGRWKPARVHSGAIFRATLDRTHWLTYGYERISCRSSSNRVACSSLRARRQSGGLRGKDLTLAGFTWPDNTEKYLRNSVWATVENSGSGRVIVFADNPVYRGFWRGTAKLFD